MRFKQYLNEEYAARGYGFTVYINPTTADYKELRKESGNPRFGMLLRTIIDVKNKKIWVWDALKGVHIDGFNVLKKAGEIKLGKDSAYNIFCGAGDLEVGDNKMSGGNDYLSFVEYIRWYGLGSQHINKMPTLDEIAKKMAWLKKYYKGSCEITPQEDIRGPRFTIG